MRARARKRVPAPRHNALHGATGAEYRAHLRSKGKKLPQHLQQSVAGMRAADLDHKRAAQRWVERWRGVARCGKLRRKLDGTGAVGKCILSSREPMAWLPVGPTPPLPPRMPLSLMREYVMWRKRAINDPHTRQWKYACWRADLLHFHWRLSRYARQTKALVSYAAWWHQAKQAAEAFRANLPAEERRSIEGQIAALRKRIPEPVDPRKVYEIMHRADPLYWIRSGRDPNGALLQEQQDAEQGEAQSTLAHNPSDTELLRESLPITWLGPSAKLRVQKPNGKWRRLKKHEREAMQRAGSTTLGKKLAGAWNAWLKEHGAEWREARKTFPLPTWKRRSSSAFRRSCSSAQIDWQGGLQRRATLQRD